MTTPQSGPDGGHAGDPSGALVDEVERLREELRTCREELAQVRAENERVLEDHTRVTRARRKAAKESGALSKALAEVLFRELRDKATSVRPRRSLLRRGEGSIGADEWQKVLLLHQSPHFRPAWYLRQNLTVARRGIEPALHFLRHGVLERRDPGPDFDLVDYLQRHPDVRGSGENPVLHALAQESTGSAPVARRTS